MIIYSLAVKNKNKIKDTGIKSSIDFYGGSLKTCFLNKENAHQIRDDVSTPEYELEVVEFNIGDCLFYSNELKDIASKVKWSS